MIAAFEVYDRNVIELICRNEAISAVVLGDPFCNYRMFAGGDQEIESRMHQLKLNGKGVYYQTPACLTDRKLVETVQKIRYWNSQGMLDGVFLQDIGLLHKIAQEKTGLKLIWSYLGIARNGALNLLHYEFLQSLAPVAITTDQPERFRVMKEHGLPVLLMYGKITYSTVNRLCYYTYQNNLYGEDCRRACLSGEQKMVNETFHMEMSVDGYMLGKKYVYTESDLKPDLYYAGNYEDYLMHTAEKKM